VSSHDFFGAPNSLLKISQKQKRIYSSKAAFDHKASETKGVMSIQIGDLDCPMFIGCLDLPTW